MFKTGSHVKYVYDKYNNQPVPPGTIGMVLLYVDHFMTSKLVVDFEGLGRVIVPKSAVRICDK